MWQPWQWCGGGGRCGGGGGAAAAAPRVMEGDGGTPRRVVRVPHSRQASREKVPLGEKVSDGVPSVVCCSWQDKPLSSWPSLLRHHIYLCT